MAIGAIAAAPHALYAMEGSPSGHTAAATMRSRLGSDASPEMMKW
jgi:hypothetical protein